MLVDGLGRLAGELGDFLGLKTLSDQGQAFSFLGRQACADIRRGLRRHGSASLTRVQGLGHCEQALAMRGAANASVGPQQIQSARDLQQSLRIVAPGTWGLAQQDGAACAQLFRDLHQARDGDAVLSALVLLNLLKADGDQPREIVLRKTGGLAIGAHAGADLYVDGVRSLSHMLNLQAVIQLGERGASTSI